jgi:hypothetical protein
LKEPEKRWQFRADSWTGSLIYFRTTVLSQNGSFYFFKNGDRVPYTQPLPTGSSFEKEKTAQFWNQ